MCGGVKYRYEGEQQLVYFPSPLARLPVLKKSGELELVTWGRRREESGGLPQGGWARLESVKQGVWDKYGAQPVKVFVDEFMEKDRQGTSHWFKLGENQWIQGLIARTDDEARLYVVTVIPPMENAVHDRWPRIMGGEP